MYTMNLLGGIKVHWCPIEGTAVCEQKLKGILMFSGPVHECQYAVVHSNSGMHFNIIQMKIIIIHESNLMLFLYKWTASEPSDI